MTNGTYTSGVQISKGIAKKLGISGGSQVIKVTGSKKWSAGTIKIRSKGGHKVYKEGKEIVAPKKAEPEVRKSELRKTETSTIKKQYLPTSSAVPDVFTKGMTMVQSEQTEAELEKPKYKDLIRGGVFKTVSAQEMEAEAEAPSEAPIKSGFVYIVGEQGVTAPMEFASAEKLLGSGLVAGETYTLFKTPQGLAYAKGEEQEGYLAQPLQAPPDTAEVSKITPAPSITQMPYYEVGDMRYVGGLSVGKQAEQEKEQALVDLFGASMGERLYAEMPTPSARTGKYSIPKSFSELKERFKPEQSKEALKTMWLKDAPAVWSGVGTKLYKSELKSDKLQKVVGRESGFLREMTQEEFTERYVGFVGEKGAPKDTGMAYSVYSAVGDYLRHPEEIAVDVGLAVTTAGSGMLLKKAGVKVIANPRTAKIVGRGLLGIYAGATAYSTYKAPEGQKGTVVAKGLLRMGTVFTVSKTIQTIPTAYSSLKGWWATKSLTKPMPPEVYLQTTGKSIYQQSIVDDELVTALKSKESGMGYATTSKDFTLTKESKELLNALKVGKTITPTKISPVKDLGFSATIKGRTLTPDVVPDELIGFTDKPQLKTGDYYLKFKSEAERGLGLVGEEIKAGAGTQKLVGYGELQTKYGARTLKLELFGSEKTIGTTTKPLGFGVETAKLELGEVTKTTLFGKTKVIEPTTTIDYTIQKPYAQQIGSGKTPQIKIIKTTVTKLGEASYLTPEEIKSLTPKDIEKLLPLGEKTFGTTGIYDIAEISSPFIEVEGISTRVGAKTFITGSKFKQPLIEFTTTTKAPEVKSTLTAEAIRDLQKTFGTPTTAGKVTEIYGKEKTLQEIYDMGKLQIDTISLAPPIISKTGLKATLTGLFENVGIVTAPKPTAIVTTKPLLITAPQIQIRELDLTKEEQMFEDFDTRTEPDIRTAVDTEFATETETALLPITTTSTLQMVAQPQKQKLIEQQITTPAEMEYPSIATPPLIPITPAIITPTRIPFILPPPLLPDMSGGVGDEFKFRTPQRMPSKQYAPSLLGELAPPIAYERIPRKLTGLEVRPRIDYGLKEMLPKPTKQKVYKVKALKKKKRRIVPQKRPDIFKGLQEPELKLNFGKIAKL